MQLRLAEALVNAGRCFEAAAIFAQAAEEADPEIRLACRKQAAEQLLISGHIEQGLEALNLLLAETGLRLPATPQRAWLSLLRHRLRLRLFGLKWQARHESQIPREQLLKLDVYKMVGIGLWMVDHIRGADFQARGLLLALRTGERFRVARSLVTEALYRGAEGKGGLRRARRLLNLSRQICQGSDNPYLMAWTEFADGCLRFFEGHYQAAADILQMAETRFRQQTAGTVWELNNTRLFYIFSLRHRGVWAQMRERLEQYMLDAERRGDRYVLSTLGRYGCILFLVEDRPDKVRPRLQEATWLPAQSDYHLQHWYELIELGELALYQGRAPEALEELAPKLGQLSRSLLPRVQLVRVMTHWLRGRLALDAGCGGCARALAASFALYHSLGRMLRKNLVVPRERPFILMFSTKKGRSSSLKGTFFCAIEGPSFQQGHLSLESKKLLL
jgi:hypothetical protein